ncbi:hypothetical protein SUGI_1169280 [Cryptomeria japonica]|uniref:AT-rich interactive domain-containing protein 4 n=1 Tax=Cryptomeria japonica TaxID=3369 RepID=UPI002414C8E2|nr:AT-rich interactive domain-containing protein 4 [Cryptomeria japonica]GLJ54441.1 hypothetical protein SUGI_1169280 [Cryptomeria japonica]
MSNFQVSPKRVRPGCNVLVVICRRRRVSSSQGLKAEEPNGFQKPALADELYKTANAFADIALRSSVEVQVLEPLSKDELQQRLEFLQPAAVYFTGEVDPSRQEFGPLFVGDLELCNADDIASLFKGKLPNLVCMEISDGIKLGEGLCSKGIPYVVVWKGCLTMTFAILFRQAFLPAIQSGGEVWDSFQVAKASFQFHSSRLHLQSFRNGKYKASSICCPTLLGKPPSVMYNHSIYKEVSEEGVASITSGAVQIFEDNTEIRLLLRTEIGAEEPIQLSALQDGINALLTAEVRGTRLMHRNSAPLPPAAASALVRGMVAMRCDVCSSSFARISLVVSGSAEICLKDEVLEHCIRKQLVNRSPFVQFISSGDNKSALRPGMRQTVCVASGASTVEACIKASTWAGQILRQLALQPAYWNLVSLGIAGVDGVPVAAFHRDDSNSIASLKQKDHDEVDKKFRSELTSRSTLPVWFAIPVGSRKRVRWDNTNIDYSNGDGKQMISNLDDLGRKRSGQEKKSLIKTGSSSKQRLRLLEAMKPVPHSNKEKLVPFGTMIGGPPGCLSRKAVLSNGGVVKGNHFNVPASPVAPGNDGNYPAAGVVPPQHALSLGFSATRKHGCSRQSLDECSEVEFLEDLTQFLVSRGHGRLIPLTGIDQFPNVVLNGKRLDLYNLYREVVTRGGFYVGNGINWKGQIFPKMRNHTMANRITGVGNTLKRHYETYLLEYELAHDDVGGECCVLCYSGAEGDWVNCGICRQWAHFGCDRRTGLGAFKDYAKTDGREYICPRCTVRVLTGGKDSEKPR